MVFFPSPSHRSIVIRAVLVPLTTLLVVAPLVAAAEPSSRDPSGHSSAIEATSIEAFIADASARFGIPHHWIRAVMQAESAGDPRAVSHAGAMGLMQIMPATWAELRAEHGLGSDPFDPRDNILAGAAYLRAMYDAFGSPGFLAAYNAGPERYRDHLATGRPLPRETRAYTATLLPLLDASAAHPIRARRVVQPADWRAAPLFVAQVDRQVRDVPAEVGASPDPLPADQTHADRPRMPSVPDGLFARPRPEGSE